MIITKEQIEEIRQRASIVDIVGDVVSLKQKGKRWWGCCPFHHEKTPSFCVTSDNNLFYCFGCHAGGDLFSFVMQHAGLGFQETAKQLAARYGILLAPEPEHITREKVQQKRHARVNALALEFFVKALHQSKVGQQARDYLLLRKVKKKIIGDWRLGFGGAAGELLSYLHEKNVPTEEISAAGLLNDAKDRSLFDGRLIFPIIDEQNRVAGFGGRALREGERAKYINSRETPLFQKRRLLYGLAVAQSSIRRSSQVVLVEGFMDVLACHDAGVENAVASLGTAFHQQHAVICGRLAKEVVVLFDADTAGQRAALEVAETLLAEGLKVSSAELPKGSDPDSVVKKSGAAALHQLLANKKAMLDYCLSTTDWSSLSIEARATRAQELAPLLFVLQSGLERDLYTARLARLVGVTNEQLQVHLKNYRPKKKRQEPSDTPVLESAGNGKQALGKLAQRREQRGTDTDRNMQGGAEVPTIDPVELELLRELLLFPDLRGRYQELQEYVADPLRLLIDELATEDDSKRYHILLKHLGEPRTAARLLMADPLWVEEESLRKIQQEQTFMGVLNRFKHRYMVGALKDFDQELQRLESDNASDEDITDLLIRRKNLALRMRQLRITS